MNTSSTTHPNHAHLDLPPELLHAIISYVQSSSQWEQGHLLSIMLTSRTFYGITLPLLYRQIRLRTRRAAYGCFTMLTKNDLAAASVRELRILERTETEWDDNYQLIPLLSQALLRIPNLKLLTLDNLLYGKFQDEPFNQHRPFFELPYEFKLDTLIVAAHLPESQYELIVPFLSQQTQLRHFSINFPPGNLIPGVSMPNLTFISLRSPTCMDEHIAKFFSDFPHISDVAVYFSGFPLSFPLVHIITGVLRYAPNLKSLSIMFWSLKRARALSDWIEEPPRSNALQFLTIVKIEDETEPGQVLLAVNQIPDCILQNLKSVLFEYSLLREFTAFQWSRAVWFSRAIQGVKFYFGRRDEKVILAQWDSENHRWDIQAVDWMDVPIEHAQAVERAWDDWET